MPPKVLLAYANPAVTAQPVPPYGMERIGQAFRMAGCEVRLEAPFLEADPVGAFRESLAWKPDLVGLSVRNVDDALVVRSVEGAGDIDTTFWLEDVKPLVAEAVAAVGAERVLVGGTAVSSGPEAVLRYLGATWGITGPAEDLCWRIGRALAQGRLEIPDDVRVVRPDAPRPRERGFGSDWKAPPGPTPRMGGYLALAQARGGRVAVQLSAGCDRRCHFCVEAHFLGFRVAPRPVDDVVAEITMLAKHGVRRIWLAASELNVPNDRHAIEVLRRIGHLKLDLQGFVQVAPVSDELLDAMEGAGLDPTGLSFEFGHLDERILKAGGGPANRAQVDKLVETWLRRGYQQLGGSVLLGSHWLENEDTVAGAIAAAREIDAALPLGLGLAYATGSRVYPETALARWVAAHREEARADLYGAVDDVEFVRPVVFCRPGSPRRLLAHVTRELSGTKGQMRPMNAEAPADAVRLRAEAFVNRGIWRLHQERPEDAERCLAEAVALAPDHLEALKQLALVRANALGDAPGAVDALTKLRAALPAGDPRHEEIGRALVALGGA